MIKNGNSHEDRPVAAGSSAGGSLAGARWPAYAAAWCALIFAVLTFYWALGGTFLLDTIGQEVLRLARTRDTTFVVAGWVSALLKLAGAVLALALVQPWGGRIPRRLLLGTATTGAVVLVLYGGLQIVVQVLVLLGVLASPAEMDWRGFYGHLFIWDPWFLVWGVLLGWATLVLARRPPIAS
jgi:hypothetical protein